jgi:hypothetical protein
LAAALTAATLLAWLGLLALESARTHPEPKTLRYRIRHTAARLVCGGAADTSRSPRPGSGRQ